MAGQKMTTSKVSKLLSHEFSFKIDAICGRRAFHVFILNSKDSINTQLYCLIFPSDGQSSTCMLT